MVVPLTTVGPYQLVEQLGESGLLLGESRVFLGAAPNGERVVVRVVEADTAADPRFRTEVAAARRVDSAFTVPVVAADLDAAVPWLATAYVTAPALAEVVRDRGPAPADTLRLLATGLASGLRAIHDAGLVHRDLSPSNILLTPDGPQVAGLVGSPGASPAFWAPEQALGQDAGPPADIFSLGAVLVFAATGHGPFGVGSQALLMYRLVNSPAELGGVPAELRSLVGRCLAKQPEARPTAAELVAWLGAESGPAVSAAYPAALGSTEPLVTTRPSVVRAAGGARTRTRGAARTRSRGPAWIAAGVLAACAAAIVVLTGAVQLSPTGHGKTQTGAVAAEPEATSQAPLIQSSAAPGAGGSAPARHAHSAHAARVTPSTLQGPVASSFLSPAAPVSGPPSASASASSSSSSSSSPSASASSSASPSASPSPSPSPSPSTSPSSSPSTSPSTSPSSSPSTSPSTSSSSSPSTSTSSSTSPSTSTSTSTSASASAAGAPSSG
ncbi:MAG TPA: serine/threonine-protein kinase [Streptosporangiaceae bacterium]|nr:serine/threonine-protein kinase [Streptosporangiaceae bacterium]